MVFMNKKEINKIVNNNIIILGNDVNSFLTSYAFKQKFPEKNITHLIVSDNKNVILNDNVFLDDEFMQKFDLQIHSESSLYSIQGFYDDDDEGSISDLKSYNITKKDLIRILKDKSKDLGVIFSEGVIKDITQTQDQPDDGSVNSKQHSNLFNDFSYTRIKFDNYGFTDKPEIKDYHAGFFIDCMGKKSFFFDDDYFDKTKHFANTVQEQHNFKHQNDFMRNNELVVGVSKNINDLENGTMFYAKPDYVLYESVCDDNVFYRLYYYEHHKDRHNISKLLKDEYGCDKTYFLDNINSIRKKVITKNVFGLGETISHIEPIVIDDSIITQKLLLYLVELFKHNHINIYKRKQWTLLVNKILEEVLHATSLHYALTTRCDSKYWEDIMNIPFKADINKLTKSMTKINLSKILEYNKLI